MVSNSYEDAIRDALRDCRFGGAARAITALVRAVTDAGKEQSPGMQPSGTVKLPVIEDIAELWPEIEAEIARRVKEQAAELTAERDNLKAENERLSRPVAVAVESFHSAVRPILMAERNAREAAEAELAELRATMEWFRTPPLTANPRSQRRDA